MEEGSMVPKFQLEDAQSNWVKCENNEEVVKSLEKQYSILV